MIANPLDRAERLIRSRAGLKAEPASRARLERLLHESANLAGLPMQSYVNMVDTQPAAFDELLDRVTVQHSGFFRDAGQFVALAELVRKASRSPHTVWSAGCGNGQEPYSLAMLLDEIGCSNWHVVASDVSFHALARTEKAIYTEREIQGLSLERRRKYLLPNGGGFEIAPFLRSNVRIAHHNLARASAQPVVPEVAAVFCRNVLMYFGRDAGRMSRHFEPVQVAGVLCYRRLGPTPPPEGVVGRRLGDLRRPSDFTGLLAEGGHAAASGDLRAAVRAFRQATYLDPNVAIAYFQLGAALELAGDDREARRAFGAAGLAMMRGDRTEDLSGLGGYTRRDLARAIASKLTETEK